jgi:uncharacterized protein (TIGR00255 family)
MICSMTGYSMVRVEEPEYSLAVSIKSINHRFLDLQMRLPPGFDAFEPTVRRLVKEHMSRGHVEVTVGLERAARGELQLNRSLLEAYLAACERLRGQFGYTSEPDLVALLRVPGIVEGANGAPSPGELDRFRPVLEKAVAEALRRLNQMRAQEGVALERDLRSRLERLERLRDEIEANARRVPQLYRKRLEARLRELLEGAAGAGELDSGRLHQEVAYLASRSDVTEELTRLRSHLEQTERLLRESSEVGKKLDFLLQEMNREANTVLSKTTDVPEVGPLMARLALDMKTEIEKLREQTQNIE